MTITKSERIYFDHCATTKMYDEVKNVLLEYLGDNFGNPSSLYQTGRSLRKALDDARETLANEFGCDDTDIIFTSGGTESDNLAVYGCANSFFNSSATKDKGQLPQILVSSIEHEAVLKPAHLIHASLIKVLPNGVLDLEYLQTLLEEYKMSKAEVLFVSVMLVNNETGVIQPIGDAADLVKSYYPDALIHSDCVQAFASLDVREMTGEIDLMSFSAHKFGGPMGTGALVVRKRARRNFQPVMRGGEQERGYRSGTENLPAIIAMAKAAQVSAAKRAEETKRLSRLAQKLKEGIKEISSEIIVVSEEVKKIEYIILLHTPNVFGEEICYLLDKENIEVSTGSACAAGAREPSHVLLAMGWPRQKARQVIRISLGWTSSDTEIDRFLHSFSKVLKSFG